MIALGGLSVVLSGLVTMNPVSPAVANLHSALGLPLLVAIPPALLLIGHALRGNRRWRGYAATSALIGLIAALLVAAYIVMAKGSIVDGLFQRTYQGVLTPWFVTMGSASDFEMTDRQCPGDPKVERPAPATEDHPLECSDVRRGDPVK